MMYGPKWPYCQEVASSNPDDATEKLAAVIHSDISQSQVSVC